MKHIFVASMLFLLVTQGYSQESLNAKNNFNLDIFSNASLISANYETYFAQKEKSFLAASLGIGYQEEFSIEIWGNYTPYDEFLTLPHYISYNVGNGRHYFESGLGGAMVTRVVKGYETSPAWVGYSVYPIVGYRFQPSKKNNLNFRIHLSYPLVSTRIEGERLTDWILFLPVGGSLGWSF